MEVVSLLVTHIPFCTYIAKVQPGTKISDTKMVLVYMKIIKYKD